MAKKPVERVKKAEQKKTSTKTTLKKTTAQELRNDRYFVMDTSVLLHDSNSLFAFKGVVVVIPLVVLEELDTFKTDRGEKGRNAREIIRTLDDLRSKGRLNEGVPLGHDTEGSILRVLPTPHNEAVIDAFCASTADNQIIALVHDLADQGFKTTLVTKDINARVKTDALGLDAEDYLKGIVTTDQYYKGWQAFPMSPFEIKGMNEKRMADAFNQVPLTLNEYVILESSANSFNNRIFRYLGGKSFKEVVQPQLGWDFKARNIQQLMAFDLLMDDSIKLVTLLGPAGTGKTFIALLAGLYKVMKMHTYRKFLISRPVVALGADIGYLPGDVQEKLFHWMGPVYDNLEFIFNHMNKGNAEKAQALGENAEERRHKKRHEERNKHGGNHHNKHHDAMPTRSSTRADIDRLQEKGILSLEAITYMRGRSIPNQFVFIDEVQNLTPHEVKTIVSRAGEGTKVILAGDPYQIDSPYLDFTSNGLTVTSEKFKNHELFGTAFLQTSERSELAKLAASIL